MASPLRALFTVLILLCLSTGVARATPPACTITGVVYKADLSVCGGCNITFRTPFTQVIGGETIAIPGITVTTNKVTGAIPPNTNFPQGLIMTVQVDRDKAIGVTIATGSACPETFGTLLQSGGGGGHPTGPTGPTGPTANACEGIVNLVNGVGLFAPADKCVTPSTTLCLGRDLTNLASPVTFPLPPVNNSVTVNGVGDHQIQVTCGQLVK